MNLLKNLLEARGIQAIEAGGNLAPAQNAFCAKICSKIITAQFCAVLLNNDEVNGEEIPNANVNMEYGLMIGFNKYVIPFQRASQRLPFNVAGLDTIKYTNSDFARLAGDAIDQAIRETQQDSPKGTTADQNVAAFLFAKKMIYAPINTDGDKNVFELGRPLGFNLLNDFSGLYYTFLGNFSALRPEAVIWRVNLMMEILSGRRSGMPVRVQFGIATPLMAAAAEEFFKSVEIWILVTGDADKTLIEAALQGKPFKCKVYSQSDVENTLDQLGSI